MKTWLKMTAAAGAFLTALLSVSGAVINIVPTDPPATSYTKIEAARAGDEVIIAPGTYSFRLHLTAKGTATNPISIHAQDPNNKPVWDFNSTLVENAPGSYTAGDRGRGGWQVDGGSYYRLSGIIFQGCHTASLNSAGVRYYNGATGLYLKDCIFRNNDNGLTGGTQESDAVVEFCEFDSNGNLAATSPTHNLYIYGGTFTLRYSYVHDSVQAQNFHIRARSSTLEYNWFARARSYEGDLMTDDDFGATGQLSQGMIVRGNLFLQHTNPGNHSQVVVIYNDGGLTNVSFSMQVINNTYVGNGIPGNGAAAAFVHLSNADGTWMSAQVVNNIISGTTLPTLVENGTGGSISGGNNWLANGVNPGPLTNSVFSATPGFRNAAAKDFMLATDSVAIGGANAGLTGLPIKEYFQNETNARQYRLRATAKDIGAFESTTAGSGIGPYTTAPAPRLSASWIGSNVVVSWPVTAPDYGLEQASALGPDDTWIPVSAPYNTNPADIHVAMAATSNTFFRLRHY